MVCKLVVAGLHVMHAAKTLCLTLAHGYKIHTGQQSVIMNDSMVTFVVSFAICRIAYASCVSHSSVMFLLYCSRSAGLPVLLSARLDCVFHTIAAARNVTATAAVCRLYALNMGFH